MRLFAPLVLLVGCVPELTGTVEESYVWEEPSNTWGVNPPPEELEGQGFEIGEVPEDFLLTDQHGDTVSLWQFYGSVVVVDISTMWCAPCRDLAETTEQTYQDLLDEDFMYITVLAENIENEPASVDDLNAWGDAYGITAPVVSDPHGDWSDGSVENGQYPVVFVLDRELTIADRLRVPDDPSLHAAVDVVLGAAPAD